MHGKSEVHSKVEQPRTCGVLTKGRRSVANVETEGRLRRTYVVASPTTDSAEPRHCRRLATVCYTRAFVRLLIEGV